MTAAVAALFAAILSFQLGAAMATHLVQGLGALPATALRLMFAAPMLVAVFRPWRARLPREVRGALLGYGVALGSMNFFIYLALAHAPLGIAVALEFTGPLTVTMLHARRKIDFLWIGLTLLGLYLLLPLRGPVRDVSMLGAGAALAAGASWAAYMVLGKQVGAALGMQASAIGTVIAAVVLVPVGIVAGGRAVFTPHALLLGLALGVFSSALPYPLEMLALTRMPVRLYGTLTSTEPAVAALIGLVLLGQHILPWRGVGRGGGGGGGLGTAMTIGEPVHV